ncbi:MAG: MGMT family protein [Candidatus Lokiarchaeota archaeon]|nr:MGMT family protein [Candidatus Lokiarchaeota archaeon]
MAVFYFKPKIIDPFIFVLYDYQESEQKIKLKEITFFEAESDLLNYIKEFNLSITKVKNSKEQSILIQLQNSINEYLTNGKTELIKKLEDIDVLLDLKNIFKSDFSEKILHALINIKPGELTTYSELAEKINSRAFRAVGGVLKNNPLPLIIPCHRVIKKDGTIGGFMGKMNKVWQIQLKRSLLEIESNVISD